MNNSIFLKIMKNYSKKKSLKRDVISDISNVILSKKACENIIKVAKDGYSVPYKQERLGILLGRLKEDTIFVTNAILYKGSKYTRTSVSVESHSIEEFIKKLVKKLHLRFLRSFHTHNEVANTISSILSEDDKYPISENYRTLIEITATIWVSDSPLQQSLYYCQARSGKYRIRIAAYRSGGSFPIFPVR
jgi:hypothetical protein